MFYKLAISNIKKSYKDYLIYFVTLTMGIMLFYLFNSIESQKIMLDLSEVKSKSLEIVFGAMNFISVFISLALAFLMLYANRFLIKRRKKELGIYLLLGMDRLKVSYLLVMETMIVGVLSLLIGIVGGVIASHFFSLITAQMFQVDVHEFHFIFSSKAALKTTLFFGIIFSVDMLLNTWTISRLKLINLLYARRRNQELKVTNPRVNRMIFVLSLIVLGISYYCITVNGMMSFDLYFKVAIIFGIIGTLLFFMSLSGMLIRFFKREKSIFYKDLNIFTLRQVGSKVNSTFILMSLVSIMLLIAIGTFSTGMGMADVMGDALDDQLPFDDGYKLWHNFSTSMDFEEIVGSAYLNTVDYALVDVYESSINLGGLLKSVDETYQVVEEVVYYTSLNVVSLNDYNNNLILQGKKPISLLENEFLINYNYDPVTKDMEWLSEKEAIMTLNGHLLTLKGSMKSTILNEPMAGDNGTFVVHESVLMGLTPVSHIININYRSDETVPLSLNLYDYPGYSLNRDVILADALGIRTVLSYFAIYVGIVFIMSSVVILSLQLLTEVSDNVERYQLLMKLGVDKADIKKSLFTQISLYFMMPLALGIIHSYVGLKVSTEAVRIVGNLDILSNLLTTATFVIIIYGAYFTTTYATMKAIVLGQR